MGFGGRQASPPSSLAVFGGRQLGGDLGQLCSGRRCPASDGAAHGGIERGGDVRIRSLGGEREVPRPLLVVGDDRGEEPVSGAAPPGRRVVVADGGEQRMGETHARVLDLEHPGARSPFERVRDPLAVAVGRCQHGHGRPRECRRGEEHLARLSRETVEALADELPQRGGNPERVTGDRSPGRQLASELKREEGVSTRHLAQVHELGAGELEPEPTPQQLKERAEAERADRKPLDRSLREQAIDVNVNVLGRRGPSGREEANRFAGRRRSANWSTPAEDRSSHWRSSTATTTGLAAASARRLSRTPSPMARGSEASRPGSVKRSATWSARRRGAVSDPSTSSTTSPSRSESPAKESAASTSTARSESTLACRFRACTTPSGSERGALAQRTRWEVVRGGSVRSQANGLRADTRLDWRPYGA